MIGLTLRLSGSLINTKIELLNFVFYGTYRANGFNYFFIYEREKINKASQIAMIISKEEECRK